MDQMSARGHVDAFLISPAGETLEVASGKNTLSYVCADAVARLFGGDITARPQKIGFVTGASGLNTFSFTDGERNKTQSDIVGTGLSVDTVGIDPNPKTSDVGPVVMSDGSVYSGISVDVSNYSGDEDTVVTLIVTEASSVATTNANMTWSSDDTSIASTTATPLTSSGVDLGLGLKVSAAAVVPAGTYKLYVRPYKGNVVTLSAMTTNNSSATYVYGFLLKDGDGNVLAVKKLSSAVSKPANYAMSVAWAVTFN